MLTNQYDRLKFISNMDLRVIILKFIQHLQVSELCLHLFTQNHKYRELDTKTLWPTKKLNLF